jgi:4-amino-4-deoxy-L-arabinose transferase-like glycosyltransferase
MFFLLAGLAILPHVGVQNDEALFSHAVYGPSAGLSVLKIGHSELPLMLMSYLGTLKAWIYRPIFHAFGTGIAALRVPVLLAGAASLWLFFLLLFRIAGERAAVIGCILLAADSTYLLTATFDWGPVALQHLLCVGGLLLVVRFHRTRGWGALAGGFFLFGLAMWDKSLAVWLLSGFAVGGILTVRRQIFDAITPRRLGVALLAFALGALPLVVYNVDNRFATFHGNFHYDTHDLPVKVRLLAMTLSGSGLLGWLVADDWQTPHPHAPQGLLPNASARVSSLTGRPERNLMLYGFILALLLAPFATSRGRRAILFALIAMAVGWIQMAVNSNTGGSVHHTILLWPLPYMVIAIAFADASRRLGRAGISALAVVSAVLFVSGALVTNEYYARALRNGSPAGWTDAIFGLSDYLKGVPASYVYCVDWGMGDNLRLLNRGKLPLREGADQVSKPELSEDDRRIAAAIVSDSHAIFLAHTREFEFFHNNDKLIRFAASQGYGPQTMAVIPDNFGRQMFEVYSFVPAARP